MLLTFLSKVDHIGDRKFLANIYRIYYGGIQSMMESIEMDDEKVEALADHTMINLGRNLSMLRKTPIRERAAYISRAAQRVVQESGNYTQVPKAFCEMESFPKITVTLEEQARLDSLCELSKEELLLLQYDKLGMEPGKIAAKMKYPSTEAVLQDLQDIKALLYGEILMRVALENYEVWDGKRAAKEKLEYPERPSDSQMVRIQKLVDDEIQKKQFRMKELLKETE